MAASVKSVIEVGGRPVSVSNLDKVLWPRDGYTKGDLIAYYRAMAPTLFAVHSGASADARNAIRTASTAKAGGRRTFPKVCHRGSTR